MGRYSVNDFIERAILIHGNRYDYSKVVYTNNHTKVCIICPEHGEFWQTPNAHLNGQGCPKCGMVKRIECRKKTTENFILEAASVHGNKYDYSKVHYKNINSKICIICPEHGEFWQRASAHLKGHGCTKCAIDKNAERCRSNRDEFVKKAKKIYGDKYDYSKVKYVNNGTKVCIICHEHGEFWQTPANHLRNEGCPKCGNELISIKRKSNVDDFIEKAQKIHNNKYDYSNVIYINCETKVCIICPEHGEFWQKPHHHLNGVGCPECAKKTQSEKQKLTLTEFIEKSKKKHGDKYDYTKSEYIDAKSKICIICPEHGEFWQEAMSHMAGAGCPRCGTMLSQNEDNTKIFIENLGFEVIQRSRSIIKPYEIDLYIPSLKLGIEYNGLRWHSMQFKTDKNYHLDKLNLCKERGIKLIQMFEDEYINHEEIVLSKIKHLLSKDDNLPMIMGRKCAIKEIKYNESKDFLDKNHIQGSASATVYLGCYYGEQLVGVMTFKREKDNKWELNRFASDINYRCIGVGGKMFSYFVKNYNPEEVKSFADRRWTVDEENNLYIQLGFEFNKYVKPDYKYYNPTDGNIRQHKFGFRKQTLHKKYGLPLTMTEDEMTKELGYYKVYDCGLIKYIWKK